MSAAAQLLNLASMAGPTRAVKVVTGLLRMHARYFLVGRGRGLAKALPLSTPMKIHVDPASGCISGVSSARRPIRVRCGRLA